MKTKTKIAGLMAIIPIAAIISYLPVHKGPILLTVQVSFLIIQIISLIVYIVFLSQYLRGK
jgi:hypothetical protein